MHLFNVCLSAFFVLHAIQIVKAEEAIGEMKTEKTAHEEEKQTFTSSFLRGKPAAQFTPRAQPDASVSGSGNMRRVYVEFAPGKKANVQAALHRSGAQFHYTFDDLRAFTVSASNNSLAGLAKNPSVERIEDDPIREPYRFMTERGSYDSSAIGSSRQLLEQTPYGVTMVQAPSAWDSGYNGSGIKVCIIDSGIDADHEDLTTATSGYDTSSEPWDEDTCEHGTHVAGTIAAIQGNDMGVIGVAYMAELFIVKVFSGRQCRWVYSSTLLDAAQKCQGAGAKIISMSLGGGSESTVEEEGFANLKAQGILPIAAAGNDGNTATSYPAGYAAVVSVAAVDSNKNVASFSQKNSDVELAAPGVHVLSTTNRNTYSFYDGTSMATPHVSAVAALVWSAKLDALPEEVLHALQQTAEDRGASGRDHSYGFGIVQAMAAINYLNPAICSTDGDCDDGNSCTDDTCQSSVCRHNIIQDCTPCNADADCDDGNVCTEDTCTAEVCEHGTLQGCTQPGISVGSLTANTLRERGGQWSIVVTLTENNSEAGVVVTGHFDPGHFDPGSSTTGETGQCSFSAIASRTLTSATFTVDDMAKNGYVYNAGNNVQTTITITKP
jgi:hypothetical protein